MLLNINFMLIMKLNLLKLFIILLYFELISPFNIIKIF